MSQFSHHNLTEKFYRTSNAPKYYANILGIGIPEPLYDLYLRLYQSSVSFADALQAVIDDGEHRLAMQEAADAGYKLPDIYIFQQDLKSFKEFLSGFDPYKAELRIKGGIKLPYETARNLHAMVHYDCVMVSKTFAACFETEYLKYFKDLKAMNISYAGPTALAEAMDVLLRLMINSTEHDRQREKAVLPERKEWPALLV